MKTTVMVDIIRAMRSPAKRSRMIAPGSTDSPAEETAWITRQASRAVKSRTSAQAKLNNVVEIIGEGLDSEVCSIYLLREGMLELFATRGLNQSAVHVTRMAVGEGLTGTIAENIAYGRIDSYTQEEVEDAARRANIHDFILTLEDGYDTYVGERGIKLSGGQKQRISIARMFMKNPPILIFDEATSALDTKSEKVVQASMEELSKDRTTFIIAHRLSTVRNAKRILVLTENGIEESGAHQELMARGGAYAELYQAFLE